MPYVIASGGNTRTHDIFSCVRSGGKMKKKNANLDVDLDQWVDAIGPARIVRELKIHRSTLARWRSGARRAPGPVRALLRLWAEGRLPGMGSDWYGFRFEGDALVAANGARYTARQIMGWCYQVAALEAMQAKCRTLEARLVAAIKDQPRETANDRFAHAQDARSRAFAE